MRKIVTVVGARPQFVKAAVLSRLISKNKQLEEVIIHTGQHFDTNMSDVFFSEMDISKPKYNLGVNTLNHGAMTGKMLEKVENVLLQEKPSAVVVYGDTNSTVAGALAAKKLHIKVIHIEAGLRSFNTKMPEEINRIITDRISDLLLCPTDASISNLKKESFSNFPIQIEKTGDIMKDAVDYYNQFSKEKSSIIKDLKLKSNNFVLATIHRRENTDNLSKLKEIFEGLLVINKSNRVILPLHPNTKSVLKKNNLDYPITTIPPVGYFDMLELLKSCNLVITDSGGLQKEAFFNKKHCIIMRDETEWVELVDNGFATVKCSNKENMQVAFKKYQNSKSDFSINLYGDRVGETIHKSILSFLQNKC